MELGLWERGISDRLPHRDDGKEGILLQTGLLVPGSHKDGGRGGRVVRAHFPLRAEQTEVSYWKADSL